MVSVLTPPPDNPSREDIIWLAGPRLIGLVLNWWLFGALTVQVYVYHVNFAKDKNILKLIVYGVYLLDWVQTALATYDAFQWFVYGWGSIPALYGLYTAFLNVPALSSIIGAIVQVFFGWRIFCLSRSWIIFTGIILLALLQLGGGGAVAYYLYTDASEVTRSDGLVRAVGVRLGGSAVVDTVIAVFMTYYLVRSRNRVLLISSTNTVLTRLVQLTIETGTITAIAAVVDLIFFLKAHNGLHQVSGVLLCKLYSNTLLVLFNNRLTTPKENIIDIGTSADTTIAFASVSSSRRPRSSDVELTKPGSPVVSIWHRAGNSNFPP
ncbi:hypothetical protein C8R46DRAFT_1123213 [Mycena filopes]|nr:hypothetical protein C8R46DRAFT_1123041 [Mycena filopes]KAJ7151086.1 hypothetical protein C8R46DRAFT_1123213 [Mycena filopes]